MARKSRRHIDAPAVLLAEPLSEKKAKIRAAAYARVSVERTDDNRDSLETQILMINQYVEDHSEFEIIDSYQDNGYSGTTFNRPEFNRLMSDLTNGKIQCVIVKDLSRFGRNFVETGFYIETIFPKLNIRLIAINDRFDSIRDDDRKSLEIPIKNMVNAMYALDISKKRVSAFEAQSRLGCCTIGQGTFGYVVDKSNNRLQEYPEASIIVKSIFRWFLQGCNKPEIARRLNIVNAKTPSQFKEITEGIKSNSTNPKWTALIIDDILRNQTYVGDTIQGKRQRRLCNHIYKRDVDKDEWILHKNTHKALISYDDFEYVQDKLNSVRIQWNENMKRMAKNREMSTNPFAKKVVCVVCGRTMVYNRYKHHVKSDEYDGAYYLCRHPDKPYCRQRVYEDYLKAIVIEQIKHLINNVLDQKEMVKNIIQGTMQQGKMLSGKKKLANLKWKLSENEKALATTYCNLTEGVIDSNEFNELSQHFAVEKEKLQTSIVQQQHENKLYYKVAEQMDATIKQLQNYAKLGEYDQKIVDELIDKILISSDTEIEIRFKCADVFEKYFNLIEEDEQ